MRRLRMAQCRTLAIRFSNSSTTQGPSEARIERFRVAGDFANWARLGWSLPKPNHTWMDGYQAGLEFGMARPNTDQVLAAKLLSVTSPMQQHLYAHLNGYLIGMFAA